jgi:proton glutamate symport protein
MARTALNVIGNSLAVLVISKWEGQFDTEKQKNYAVVMQKNHEIKMQDAA